MRHVVFAAVPLAAALACSDATLEHKGSTLPVPDMNRVTFVHNPLESQLLVLGEEGALPEAGPDGAPYDYADVTVVGENVGRGTLGGGPVAATGSFVFDIDQTELGDHVSLHLVEGEESGASTPPEAVVSTGTVPPAPTELLAVVAPVSGMADVSGAFLGSATALEVHLANQASGRIYAPVSTVAAAPLDQRFETRLEAGVGEVIVVYAVDPARPGAPSPFGRIAVAP